MFVCIWKENAHLLLWICYRYFIHFIVCIVKLPQSVCVRCIFEIEKKTSENVRHMNICALVSIQFTFSQQRNTKNTKWNQIENE